MREQKETIKKSGHGDSTLVTHLKRWDEALLSLVLSAHQDTALRGSFGRCRCSSERAILPEGVSAGFQRRLPGSRNGLQPRDITGRG